MSDIFDLDAVIRESDQEPFRFTFGGETYELAGDFDIRAAGLLADPGRIEEALARLLGKEQWERLVASPSTLGVKALAKLLDKYSQHLGLENVGESLASTSS